MTPKVGFVRVKLCQIASGQLKSAKGESFLDAYFAINIKDGMKREGERDRKRFRTFAVLCMFSAKRVNESVFLSDFA